MKTKLITYFQKLKQALSAFVRARAQSSQKSPGKENIQITDNPYLNARREWNLLTGDIVKAKHNWQIVALLALVANTLLIVGFIWLANQSEYKPYAVSVDKLGTAQFAGFLNEQQVTTTAQDNAFVRQYITQARTVIVDPMAQKRALSFVYAVSQPSARERLNEYYRKASPFSLAKERTIEVQINSLINKGGKTWQASWTEISRSLDGRVQAESHWEGLVSISTIVLKDEESIYINPLGLSVTSFNWSKRL